MKNYKYFIYTLCVLFLAFGCGKEKFLNTELETFERQYDKNSTDPVFKYVSEYFFKYDKQFIVDPVIGDYVYNFDRVHEIEIDQIDQTQSNVLEAIKLAEELFLSKFTDHFIKNVFPASIIIADTIRTDWDNYSKKWNNKPQFYSGRYFFAFLMNKDIMAYSDEEKKSYSAMLVGNVIGDGSEELGIPQEFYTSGEDFFGKNMAVLDGTDVDETDLNIQKNIAHANGFINVTIVIHDGWYAIAYPKAKEDVADVVEYMLLTPKDERIEFFENNPKVAYRANLVIETLKKHGLDLTNIN